MGPSHAGIKRKRRTDGPNHPDRKKKTKPVFKKMKPSAYYSSSEDDDDHADDDDEKSERTAQSTRASATQVGVRLPLDEVEKKKAEKGIDTVSAQVAGESQGSGDSFDEDGAEEDDGVQLPNLQIDEGEESNQTDEFDVEDALSDENNEDDDTNVDDSDDENNEGSGNNKEGDDMNKGKQRQIKKRNDPSVFAASISAILSSKLTTNKRADPVLSRSAVAATNAEQRADLKLEAKARRKLTHDKKALQDRGHVRDVLGVESSEVSAAAVAEQEKRLRKTAQRGVVKLFNAVRAAQVRGEEARGELQKRPGETVGIDRRAERVNEMSKQGFLDLLVQGS